MDTVDHIELQTLMEHGRVVVLEALPAEYFAEGHLPGARNLPLEELDSLVGDIAPDKDATLVTYCTGTSCSNSRMAADRLRELGYRDVRAFEGGKDAWTEAGLPLEAGGAQAASMRNTPPDSDIT